HLGLETLLAFCFFLHSLLVAGLLLELRHSSFADLTQLIVSHGLSPHLYASGFLPSAFLPSPFFAAGFFSPFASSDFSAFAALSPLPFFASAFFGSSTTGFTRFGIGAGG